MPLTPQDLTLLQNLLQPQITTVLTALTRVEALLQALAEHTSAPTVSSLLVQEFFANQDLDSGAGAGTSIYGHPGGFRLDPRDPEVPPALLAVHQHPRFHHATMILTWQAYLASRVAST